MVLSERSAELCRNLIARCKHHQYAMERNRFYETSVSGWAAPTFRATGKKERALFWKAFRQLEDIFKRSGIDSFTDKGVTYRLTSNGNILETEAQTDPSPSGGKPCV